MAQKFHFAISRIEVTCGRAVSAIAELLVRSVSGQTNRPTDRHTDIRDTKIAMLRAHREGREGEVEIEKKRI